MAGKVESIEACYTIGGGEASQGYKPFEELYSNAGSQDDYGISADSGFVIIHTAAVGGRPRGALLSQQNIVTINLGMILQFPSEKGHGRLLKHREAFVILIT